MARQQRRVVLDRAERGHGEELLRDDQRDERHDLEVRRERAEPLDHRGIAERRRADERQPGGGRGFGQRIGPLAFRRGVHRHDIVAALEQGLEHGLAEGLLAVHHDPHAYLLFAVRPLRGPVADTLYRDAT